MKKKLLIAASLTVSVMLLIQSVISVSAAVYVQDGKFKYQVNRDNSVLWAGYTSDTVDDVAVPRYYDRASVVGVANFGLENNSKIKTVDFMEAPELSKIGMYAFSGCSSLEYILVPNSITSVDVSAFRNCAALKEAVFYGNNNIVPVEAFYNCSSLEKIELSANLKSIQSNAFAGCTSLKYLVLFDTVTYIAPNAFDGDTNLTLGVYYDSYAYHYARDNSVPYKLLDGVKLGDVDKDGEITINDATFIQRYLAELENLKGIYLYAADANKDGEVDISDATTIQLSVAECPVPYPVGEVITE